MAGSVDRDALELRRLELELQKVPLELQKLQAEVEELRSRVRVGKATGLLERWKISPAYLTVLISFLLALLSFAQYVAQREREQKFRLSVEMIKLIEQINAKNSGDQANAALALAFFGRPSVPILVRNLGVDRKEDVHLAIASSLQQIVANEEEREGVEYVVTTLRTSAESFLRRELRKPAPDVNILLGLIRAVGLVSSEASRKRALQAGTRDSVKEFYESARMRVLENRSMAPTDAQSIGKLIEEQLKAVP